MSFEVIRTDTYMVDVEADTLEEAKKEVEENDRYLNDGSFDGSEFDFSDHEEKEEITEEELTKAYEWWQMQLEETTQHKIVVKAYREAQK